MDRTVKVIKKGLICLAAALMLGGCGSDRTNIAAGMEAITAMDYQGALGSFESARLYGEDKRELLRGMGIAYMGLTNYEQAIDCFELALQSGNGLVDAMDYDINYYLAAAYSKGNRAQEAEASYDAILSMRPNEKDAYFLRGNIRIGLGKYEEALGDFDKALALDETNYDRLIQIYEILEANGYRDAGIFYLQTALDKGGSKMKAYDKGRIYYYLGDYQTAYTTLEEARSGGDEGVYLYLGKAYEAAGDYNYAQGVYTSYLGQNSSAQIYNQLGLCNMQLGDYAKALEAFQSGLRVENNSLIQSLSLNEISAYEHLGDFGKARELMEAYLQKYPGDAEAQREYEFLQTR